MTTKYPVISPKKLIEVALPLDAINAAAAKEKSIRYGHPSTLHLWWARRPLAAARAVIFAQLVHDPEALWRCQNPGQEPNPQVKGHWTKARARLFKIIEDLVLWENTTKEAVLKPARDEIRRAWRETCELNKEHPQAKELFNPERMPGLHDPFAGGGTIPLEGQRLGLETSASDLNPVAVTINKAMTEIPPKFAGRPPVGPLPKGERGKGLNFEREWPGATGLAEDVRRYGAWMRDEAQKRIGHLYPPVNITRAMVKERPDLAQYEGECLTVIAWLWTRTVKSPNPAYSHVEVPLASTFLLSNKEGKESYVQPVTTKTGYTFTVKVGRPPAEIKAGTKAAHGSNFRCLMSGSPISADYIMDQARQHGLGARLLAIVAEGNRGRVYLSPNNVEVPMPKETPDLTFLERNMTNDRRWFSPPLYGMPMWSDIFSPRQKVALTTFSDLVSEAREQALRDAVTAGLTNDDCGLAVGGDGAKAYSEAVSVLLTLAIDKLTDYNNTLCSWNTGPVGTKSSTGGSARTASVRNLFSRQAIPMTWDYGESNPLSDSGGSFNSAFNWLIPAIRALPATVFGSAVCADAATQEISQGKYICTDPPYYDNIGYADLSDFFYVWMRRSLKPIFPGVFATLVSPKTNELVASPFRHGSKDKAEAFFLDGMSQAIRHLAEQAHPAAPIIIYYAFKQSETKSKEGTSSTGWETFLGAVLKSGLAITGTWPMRTELSNRMVGSGTNALASSIVLVCRTRGSAAGMISRRQFIRQLNETLPLALDAMTRESEGLQSPVAPVDLSQAIIGPGMAIFSRYDAVLEADGTPMTVRTALQLINRFLAEDDFDADTQFCLHWFEQYGWEAGKFGEADTLARAKGTSVGGVQQSGVIEAGGGNVRLLKWREYPADWDPASDVRLPVWETLHQLIRAYNAEGDSGAAKVLAAVAGKAEAARQLAYRLYTLSERAGRAEDARAYNEVVTGWSGIESAAVKVATPRQRTLFELEEAS
jgi:putative DNA methylase